MGVCSRLPIPQSRRQRAIRNAALQFHPSPERQETFILRHRVGEAWEFGARPARVPYNLPELTERPNDDITLVEGEKAVEYQKAKGILATCVQGQNWTSSMMEFFVGRTVNVAMDNDDAGYDNIETAREWLGKVNATLRVIDLPNSPPAAGLDDWIEQHGVEKYRALVEKTRPEGMITPTAYTFPPEETIAVYDWLYGRHILRGEVCGTAAMGGTGKSNLSIIEAISMASGKQLLHDKVAQRPLRVVLINLEDNRNTMAKRIAAVMRHYKLTEADIGDRLIVIAKGEIKITVATQRRGGEVERNEKCIKMLTALMIKHRADMLSIDSFIRTHGVSENDNKPVQAVVECFEISPEPQIAEFNYGTTPASWVARRRRWKRRAVRRHSLIPTVPFASWRP